MTEGLQSNMAVFVFVWLYCLVFWVIQDLAKVSAYGLMYHFNFNGINEEAMNETLHSKEDSQVELQEDKMSVWNSSINPWLTIW